MTSGQIALPCPFCGAAAEYDSQRFTPLPGGLSYTGHAVYCSSPDCRAETGTYDTEEQAFKYWNRRPAA